MDKDVLIARVAELAQEKGVSLNAALLASGAGKNFIDNMRRGSEPSFNKLAMLAGYFDVSIDYLIGDSEIKKPADLLADELYNNRHMLNLLEIAKGLPPAEFDAFMEKVTAYMQGLIDSLDK